MPTQPRTVAVMATLDTKELEASFFVDEIRRLGAEALVIDVGVLGGPTRSFTGVDRAAVARAAGWEIEDVRSIGSRGEAVSVMRDGAASTLTQLHLSGAIHGVLAIGGAEGAVMGAGAMGVLPIGFPKLLVSPVLSGKRSFEPFVGVSDMMMLHSVVDISGINRISESIYRNAAMAIVSMAREYRAPSPASMPHVGITMLGNTDRAVKNLDSLIQRLGWQPVVFHSNGAGGRAMEQLAVEGELDGIIDLTTNEIADEICGGLQSGGPDRMAKVAELGLPTVIGLGCSDFFVVSAHGIEAGQLAGRITYYHNPEFLLVRLRPDEMLAVADRIVSALNRGTGPLSVCFPTRGLSIANHESGSFWDPSADRLFWERIEQTLRADARRRAVDAHVNDPNYAEVIAEEFELLTKQPIDKEGDK